MQTNQRRAEEPMERDVSASSSDLAWIAARYLADDWLVVNPAGLSPYDRRTHGEWLARFKTVGFFDFQMLFFPGEEGSMTSLTTLTLEDTRPSVPVKLYRYCVDGSERRMAWAGTLHYALQYGAEVWGYQPSHAALFTVEAPPESILAIVRGNRNTEYVIDTTELSITRLDG